MQRLQSEWRYLAVLNYDVDPSYVTAHLPAGLKPDLWEGKATLSVVAHLILKPKLWGIPVFHSEQFTRFGLITYTQDKSVFWLDEILPTRWLAESRAARRCPTRHAIHFEPEGKISRAVVGYAFLEGGEWAGLGLTSQGAASQTENWPWEHFLLERTRSHCLDAKGRVKTSQWEHPVWSFWEVAQAELQAAFIARVAGPWRAHLKPTPDSAVFVKGSRVASGRL